MIAIIVFDDTGSECGKTHDRGEISMTSLNISVHYITFFSTAAYFVLADEVTATADMHAASQPKKIS